MRMCEFVDEWFVLRTTQNGEFVCFQSRGKRLWSVPLRSCGAWSFAQLRGCAHDAHCLSFSSQL